MALFLTRGLAHGLARGCHHRSIALNQFYSTKPSPKSPISNDSKSSPPDSKTQSNDKPDANEPSNKTNNSSVGMAQQKFAAFKTKIDDTQRKVSEVPDNIRGYALERFINYVRNYDKVLEKKFPGAMKVYRVFMDGVKLFYRDAWAHFKIKKRMALREINMTEMTRRELELVYQMPNYMRKMAPLMIVSAIPMAHYVTMPIAYMYPRYFLTHHFWTPDQRIEFAVLDLRDRLLHNRNVFRHLQSLLEQVKNDEHYEKWKTMLGKLGSGQHPTVEEIISVQKLFSEPPYKTTSLSYTHIKHLAAMHGLKRAFFQKSKLANRAMCIHLIDMAIVREGGTANLTIEELRDSCFLRGLNASDLTKDELTAWLIKWIEVSKHVNPQNFSLFLHLPIFLTYNHPNNWKLIYQER